VILWNRALAVQERVLGAFPSGVMAVRWAPDGRRIAAIDEHGAVQIWNRDGTTARQFPEARSGVDVALSRDGRWSLAAVRENAFVLHALDGGADRPLITSHSDQTQVYTVRFSPDDRRALIGGSGFLGIWDVATGAELVDFATHTDVIAARFSPDGRLVYSGGSDRMLRIWDAETGAELASIAAPSEIYGLELDRDGKQLAVLTLASAMVWQLPRFTGDAAALRDAAACRITEELRDGALRRRDIDRARCNRTR
jgi:WD40 repeat protein